MPTAKFPKLTLKTTTADISGYGTKKLWNSDSPKFQSWLCHFLKGMALDTSLLLFEPVSSLITILCPRVIVEIRRKNQKALMLITPLQIYIMLMKVIVMGKQISNRGM